MLKSINKQTYIQVSSAIILTSVVLHKSNITEEVDVNNYNILTNQPTFFNIKSSQIFGFFSLILIAIFAYKMFIKS